MYLGFFLFTTYIARCESLIMSRHGIGRWCNSPFGRLQVGDIFTEGRKKNYFLGTYPLSSDPPPLLQSFRGGGESIFSMFII